MKKITLFLLGLLVMTSASADENEYVPLVREGVVWEYVGHDFEDENENIIHRPVLYTIEFNGTTNIGDKLYNNVYRTNYDEQCNPQEPYLVAYVKEENKIVTAIDIYKHWWSIPEILYDFNNPMFMPDNETLEKLGWEYYSDMELLDYIKSWINNRYMAIAVEVAGAVRNGYHINYDDGIEHYGYFEQEYKVVEGIGVDCRFGDLLVPYRDYLTSTNPMASLSAVFENGELVYKGFAYDEAQNLKNPEAITTVAGDKQVKSVRYYNLAGVESAQPVKGVNIKVTTYSDGTTKSEKIVR